MKAITSLKNSIIASIIVSIFCFYLYFRMNLILGFIFGIGAGAIVFGYLRTGKEQEVRRLVLFIFTFIFWIGMFSFLGWMGLESLIKWTGRHLRVYYFEGLPYCGTTLAPCIRNYPEIIFGSLFYGFRDGLELSASGIKIVTPATLSLFVLVIIPYLAAAIVFGRGWCGRLCFLGGIVEFFASGKKGRWTLSKLREKSKSPHLGGLRAEVKDIRYGLALGLILLSLGLGIPFMCITCWTFLFNPLWIAFLFVAVFIVLGVILPFMTKKRWFCIFCPIGALLSIIEGISLFRVKINKKLCDKCGECITACQTYAMTPNAVEKTGKPTLECIKCGECISACPKNCIDIYIRGTNIKARSWFLPLTIATGFTFYMWFVLMIIQVLPRLFNL